MSEDAKSGSALRPNRASLPLESAVIVAMHYCRTVCDLRSTPDHDPACVINILNVELAASHLAPLGAISRAVNEAIGRALALGDPALRDLLIRVGHAVDDVINDLEDTTNDV